MQGEYTFYRTAPTSTKPSVVPVIEDWRTLVASVKYIYFNSQTVLLVLSWETRRVNCSLYYARGITMLSRSVSSVKYVNFVNLLENKEEVRYEIMIV